MVSIVVTTLLVDLLVDKQTIITNITNITIQTYKHSLPGIVLLIVPNRKIKKAANIILLLAKLLNLYSHFAIDDQFERMAPTLVFFFMLVCRMVVDWQFDNTISPPQVDINTSIGVYSNFMIRDFAFLGVIFCLIGKVLR